MNHSIVLDWFAYNWLGNVMRTVQWIYPAAQVVHFIGLCFLIGAILLVDLRLWGFFRWMPVRPVLALLPVALAGFFINAVTGLAFFTSDPYRFWYDVAFRYKMLAIAVAGANALFFTVAEQRKVLSLAAAYPPNGVTKFCAGLSILTWFAVILFGRLLPVYQP